MEGGRGVCPKLSEKNDPLIRRQNKMVGGAYMASD